MKIAIFVVFFFSFQTLAQSDLQMLLNYTAIGNNHGEPCKYNVFGVTLAKAPDYAEVHTSVDVQWTITDAMGASGGSGSATKSGFGLVKASFSQSPNIPSYGDWNASIFGTHSAAFLTESINRGSSSSNSLILCNFVAGIEGEPCEHQSAKQGGPNCNGSPLLIDLENNGFRLGRPEHLVRFDILGANKPFDMQWVGFDQDEGFLFQDLNGNGICDDGSELFGVGSQMLLENDIFAPNGFVALGQYDDPRLGGNGDGAITQEDDIWSSLRIWLDSDADAVSGDHEVHPLQTWGLTQFDTYPTETELLDPFGNWFRFWATAGQEGNTLQMVDVFFKIADQIDRQ